MRYLTVLAVLLAPAAASAQATCVMHTACWDHACETIDGGLEMSLLGAGEGYELAWQQDFMFLMQGAPEQPDGTLSYYEPYSNTRTSVLTLWPNGVAVLSSQQWVQDRVQVSTFYGDCAGESG